MDASKTRTCLVCGRTFNEASEFDLCPDCLKTTGERYAAPQEPGSEKKSQLVRLVTLWATLVACTAIFILRLPRIRAAVALLDPPPPAAEDPSSACFSTLWQISRLIQEGRWPPPAPLSCPLAGAPYIAQQNKDDVVVSCPAPSRHGLHILRVSRHAPSVEAR